MDNESIGVKLVLQLNEYKQKLKEALGMTKQAVDEMGNKKVSVEIDDTKLKKYQAQLSSLIQQRKRLAETVRSEYLGGLPEGKNTEMALQDILSRNKEYTKLNQSIERVRNTMEAYKEQVKETSNATEKLITDTRKLDVSSHFKTASRDITTAIKKVLKYAGALIGIRAIYGMLRRAASSYLSTDEELSNRLQSTWAGLGAILSPVINWVINAFATAVSYINAFITALTGVDYIARANAKSIANQTKAVGAQTKAVKQLKNATTGIDELNIVNQDSGAGGGAGGAAQTPTIFEPTEVDTSKVQKAAEIAKTLWEDFKMGAGAFWVGLQAIVLGAVGLVVGAVKGIWEIIKGIGLGIWEFIKGIVNGIGQVVGGIFEGIVTIVKGVFSGIKQIIEGFRDGDWKKVWNGIKTIAVSIIKGLWTAIKGVISGILTFLQGLVAGIGNMFIGIINGIISLINGVIKGLNKVKIPDWMPVFGGQRINISTINKISYISAKPIQLATGGIANSRTLAEIGEAGREGVVPLTNQSAMRELGNIIGQYVSNDNTQQPIQVTSVLQVDRRTLAKAVNQANYESGASIVKGAFAV